MADWSSGVKRRFSMAASRCRKSSVSFFPGIPQSPPWMKTESTVTTQSTLTWTPLSEYWCHSILRRVVFRMHSAILPGWDNSRSQRLADRTPASVVREGLPASHRRCDNFSHCWPDGETCFTVSHKEQKYTWNAFVPFIWCDTWKTIRDFSSRYWEVMAPLITPLERGRKRERECEGEIYCTDWMTWKKKTRNHTESGKSIIFVLTLLEKPLCIFRSDWNYHSVQFWHFQKIRAEELPPVSIGKSTAFVKIFFFLNRFIFFD